MPPVETARRLLTLVLLLACATPIGAQDRPNIVLIMADDISWEAIGCYGAEDYLTPRIDDLAAKGLRFKNAFSLVCTY